MKTSLQRHDGTLTQYPASLLFPDGGGAQSSNLLHVAWLF